MLLVLVVVVVVATGHAPRPAEIDNTVGMQGRFLLSMKKLRTGMEKRDSIHHQIFVVVAALLGNVAQVVDLTDRKQVSTLQIVVNTLNQHTIAPT